MSTPSLESSLVRILVGNGKPRRPVGAGFLIRSNLIVTCAHVVNTALGRRQHAADCPEQPVFIDFPLLKHQPLLQAKVMKWFPVQENSILSRIEDIAVLEFLFDCRPVGTHPAQMIELENSREFFSVFSKVKMCGFPIEAEHGTYVNGILQGITAKGWVEIHHQGQEIIGHGFSGTAVWSVEKNAVCGIIVSLLNRQNASVAYMIPADTLIRALKSTAFSIKNVQFLLRERFDLSGISEEHKNVIFIDMIEAVVKRIMVEAFDGLTEEYQGIFSDLMDEDNPPTPEEVDRFLNENLAGHDYGIIIDKAITDLERCINEAKE
jgi:hypothetical protein